MAWRLLVSRVHNSHPTDDDGFTSVERPGSDQGPTRTVNLLHYQVADAITGQPVTLPVVVNDPFGYSGAGIAMSGYQLAGPDRVVAMRVDAQVTLQQPIADASVICGLLSAPIELGQPVQVHLDEAVELQPDGWNGSGIVLAVTAQGDPCDGVQIEVMRAEIDVRAQPLYVNGMDAQPSSPPPTAGFGYAGIDSSLAMLVLSAGIDGEGVSGCLPYFPSPGVAENYAVYAYRLEVMDNPVVLGALTNGFTNPQQVRHRFGVGKHYFLSYDAIGYLEIACAFRNSRARVRVYVWDANYSNNSMLQAIGDYGLLSDDGLPAHFWTDLLGVEEVDA